MRALYQTILADLLIAALAMFLLACPGPGRADDAQPQALDYQLDVSINGQPTGLVARFVDTGDGHFASPASELRELGIIVPDDAKDDDLIPLDRFPGLSYVYDEQKQAIALETSDANRVTKTYDARGNRGEAHISTSTYGSVLNYSLYGAFGGEDQRSTFSTFSFSGVNASLDARIVAPIGLFNQTAIVGSTLAGETDALRLESTFTFSDDEDLVRWRAGDMITGGVGWSRPVRLGGIQAQRAFSMRPDLVTAPLPAASGSAAVPSTVDVYVNGIKSYSKEVAAGPYQIDNIPGISGSGVAQVVTRDASGRETVQSLSFYTSPQLLKPGLYDFSAETGFARLNYGIESNDYDPNLVGTATVRAGINDWLTLESHGEAGDGLINGGAGFVARTFDLAIVSGAMSASTSKSGVGTQLYGSLETTVGPVTVNARSQHAFDNYEDLASLTASVPSASFNSPILSGNITSGFFNFAPPRAVDSITMSVPLTFDRSTLSTTFLNYESADKEKTQILTATYSRPLLENANMFATGFVDVNTPDTAGFYVGVNVSLDDNVAVNTGATGQNNTYATNVDVSKPLTQETGSFGWRVHDHEGTSPLRSAGLAYRAEAARAEATVYQEQSSLRGTAAVDGAIAVVGGDIYTSNRIDDSFAVVDAHAPGVKVQRENLLVGETDSTGKILIPNLASYQRNKISIDPMDLPVNTEMTSSFNYVTPGFKSGLYVNFNVKELSPNAVVVLKDAGGAFIPVGSEGQLEGSDELFVVGYDGQAFIKDLKAVNTVRITAGAKTCTAQFTFEPSSQVQPVIGPEVCQ